MTASLALDFKTYQPNIAHIPKSQKITEAEYWDKYYDYSDVTYEWNNGHLEEKAVSDFLTILMSDWFSELLGYYLKTHPIAKKTFLEMGFSLFSQTNEIRRPDLGIVLNTNPVQLLPEDNSYKGIYDLCIEAVSDSSKKDIKRDTVDKKLKYAQSGVKEYYILDGHDHRYMAFYRLNLHGVYVPIQPVNSDIIQSTVLPGFQFRVANLFTKPSPDEMIDDPVYQNFVLPKYREAKKRAEHLAEKLRSLGIDPNEI